MDNESIKKNIFEFLRKNELAVISTIHSDGSGPESAVVGFAEKHTLELIFGTLTTTRKYKNLGKDPYVSFVIGWSRETGSVQYEGVARELKPEELKEYTDILIQKNKASEKFLSLPEQRYFLVQPRWIRFNDYSGTPPGNYEVNF